MGLGSVDGLNVCSMGADWSTYGVNLGQRPVQHYTLTTPETYEKIKTTCRFSLHIQQINQFKHNDTNRKNVTRHMKLLNLINELIFCFFLAFVGGHKELEWR